MQRGFTTLLLVIGILIIGLIVGIYLVSQRTNFLPQADSGGDQSAITLTPFNPDDPSAKPTSVEVLPEDELVVNVLIQSMPDLVKKIDAQIQFPFNILTLNSIDASSFGALPVEWQTQTFDNSRGTITLRATVPGQGYTSSIGESGLLARLHFKVKPQTGGAIGKITFLNSGTDFYPPDNPQAIENLITRPLEVRVRLAAN